MRKPRSVRRSARRQQVRPPLRNGINPSPVTLPDVDVTTVDEWLDLRFGPGSAGALERGDVFSDGGVPVVPGAPYVAGERLWLFRVVPDEPDEPILLDVIDEDENTLVVDKPHDIATIPRGSFVARTVTVAARRQFSNDDLVPAHRLDAGTAGVVLLTKRPEVRGAYQNLFARREVAKKYRAIAPAAEELSEWTRVDLRIEKEHGEMRARVVPGEPNARTDVRMVREVAGGLALYDLRPHTGRTHQLRATLNHFGIPIAFDPLFPRVLGVNESFELPLQLVSSELAFTDPLSGERRRLETRRVLALENPPL